MNRDFSSFNLDKRLLSTLRKKRSGYLLLMFITVFIFLFLLSFILFFLFYSVKYTVADAGNWYQVSTSAIELLYIYCFYLALFCLLFILQLHLRLKICKVLIQAVKYSSKRINFKLPKTILCFFYIKRITEEFSDHLGLEIFFSFKTKNKEEEQIENSKKESFELRQLFIERFGFSSLKKIKAKRNISLANTLFMTLLYLVISFSNPFLLFFSPLFANLTRLLLFLIITLLGIYFLSSFSLNRWVINCLRWDETRLRHKVSLKQGNFLPALTEKYGFFGSAFFFPLQFLFDNELSFEMRFLEANKFYDKIFINFI